MEKSGKRALRRRHMRRLKTRISNRLKERRSIDVWGDNTWAGKDDPKFVGKMFHTRAVCSASCCGNPRKYFKEKTRKEKLADLIFKKETVY